MKIKTKSKVIKALQAQNRISASGELLLYGVIGDWWDELDAHTVISEMEALDGDELVIRIHSPGGLIMEGLAIYNRLQQSEKTVIGYIDGVAASMASVVAMAADTLYMPENALMMLHKPWLNGAGNADELRRQADNLDKLEESLVSIYAAKTGKPAETITELLSSGEDIWMNGPEAIDYGLADELIDSIQAVAQIDFGELSPPKDKLDGLYSLNAAPPAKTPMRKLKMKVKKATNTGGAERFAVNSIVATLAFNAMLTEDNPMEAMWATLATATALNKAELQALFETGGEVNEAQAQALATALNIDTDSLLVFTSDRTPEPAKPTATDGQAVAAQAVADERQRGADIRALGAKASLDAVDINDMIDKGLNIDQARAKAIDLVSARDEQHTPSRPNIRIVPGDSAPLREAMATAMLNRVKPEKFKAEGAAAEFRGMSIIEMARAFIGHTGGVATGLSRDAIMAKALHSTSDFPLIVADVANKTLQQAYQETPRTFQPFARQATAMDFKDKHSLNIGNGQGLELVNESGEYQRGTVSESDETYKVQTFGRVFAFTRQLMINDDLDALTRFIAGVGSLASRKESDVVYDLIKANAALSDGNAVFHSASHKNLGTGGAVTETTLAQARKLMRQQKGLDDEPINITPSFLVVNTERETESEKMLSSVLASATTDVNIFSGALQLIVEARLDGVTNNPWYVFANPAEVGGIEYAYLDGQTGPMIETRNGFDVDGVEIKVRHDFGAGWVDYRGAVKNPGV